MTDIAAFPTMRNILVSGDNIQPFTAGADITAGQVVAFHDTGVSKTVHPAVTGTTGTVVGVALYSVSSGAEVAVACRGCQCYVANGDDTTTGDAGDAVEVYGTTTAGTVVARTITVDASGTPYVRAIAGFMIEDMAANSTVLIDVAPGFISIP